MPRTRALAPAFAFALLCTSCGQPPDDPATRATGLTPEPTSAPFPATADAGIASTRYACDDGSAVSVIWGNDKARVELPDGRMVSLPKAQSASKGGGEVFVGDTVSLQREGDDIQLFQGAGEAQQCRLATAAE
jgi:hypothetical protein